MSSPIPSASSSTRVDAVAPASQIAAQAVIGNKGPFYKSETFVNFASGMAAGAAQTVIGHPFDTIKVLMQVQSKGTASPTQILSRLVKTQGISSIYKGMASPLAASLVFNSIMFGTFEWFKTVFTGADGKLSYAGFAASAALTGVCESIVYCPTELIKCRIQASTVATTPMKEISAVVASQGVGGLFKGMGPTVVREGTGNIFYFAAYTSMQKNYRKEASEMERTIMAGGSAGVAYWTVMLPVDTVKTIMQTQDSNPNSTPKYKGAMDCFTKMVRERPLSLYRGFGPVISRAFPANAVLFYSYETVKKGLMGLGDA